MCYHCYKTIWCAHYILEKKGSHHWIFCLDHWALHFFKLWMGRLVFDSLFKCFINIWFLWKVRVKRDLFIVFQSKRSHDFMQNDQSDSFNFRLETELKFRHYYMLHVCSPQSNLSSFFFDSRTGGELPPSLVVQCFLLERISIYSIVVYLHFVI